MKSVTGEQLTGGESERKCEWCGSARTRQGQPHTHTVRARAHWRSLVAVYIFWVAVVVVVVYIFVAVCRAFAERRGKQETHQTPLQFDFRSLVDWKQCSVFEVNSTIFDKTIVNFHLAAAECMCPRSKNWREKLQKVNYLSRNSKKQISSENSEKQEKCRNHINVKLNWKCLKKIVSQHPIWE